jgi:uncharacterized protein YegP (UPF0339 family)
MKSITERPFSKLEFIQIEDSIEENPDSGRWRWFLRAANHQIVACSVPSYSRRRDALRGFLRVQRIVNFGDVIFGGDK